MSSGDSPERPIFVANVPAPAEAEVRGKPGCLSVRGCLTSVAFAMVIGIAVTLAVAGARRQTAQKLVQSAQQVSQVVSQPSPSMTVGFSGKLMQGLDSAVGNAILLSWGIDRMAENGRRLDFVGQSLVEHQRLHGRPPASLSELPLLHGDLLDVWGKPLEYKVEGSPPRWRLRSAGMDRTFDAHDPWLTESSAGTP